MAEGKMRISGPRILAIAAPIAFATLVLYLAALRNGFVDWDDNAYIVDNPHIRSLGPALFRWAFFEFYASNWHPLTWISHALDYALWGLNPVGHHLTSIILHAANTFLVVLLAFKLIPAGDASRPREDGPQWNGRTRLIAAGAAGLLFGVHPLHVESVAWAAERKDVLSAFFFLLAIIAYIYFTAKRQQHEPFSGWFKKYSFAVLGPFLLALLSKPMAVTLPVVLLILDWYPLRRISSWKTFRSACIEKIPYALFSLGSAVLTVLAQRSGHAVVTTDIIPLPVRLLVAARSLFAYIWKMALPLHLLPFYPYPRNIGSFPIVYILLTAGVFAVTALFIIIARKRPFWLAVWCSYAVTLLPVLGILQVGGQAMADRYSYLPGIGPIILAGASVARASEKLAAIGKGNAVRAAGAAVVVIAFISLPVLTLHQIGIWKDSIRLWSYAIEESPEATPVANNQRGIAYFEMGLIDKAIADFDRAIVLNPWYCEAYNNRGMALNKMQQPDAAIADYDRAIALNSSYKEAYNNRGMAFSDKGDTGRAIADFERALSLDPSYYSAYMNRGIAYGQEGLFDRAIASFDRSVALNPGSADAYFNRGITYALAGRPAPAFADLSKAIELNGKFTAAYVNRGKLYFQTGNKQLAASDFQKACALGDDFACRALRLN